MKKALVLFLPLLLVSLVAAQTPTLVVDVQDYSTTLTIDYSMKPGQPPMPALVLLAAGYETGSTPLPLPFLTPAPEFGIKDAMIIPLGVIVRNGKLVVKIPFGSKARNSAFVEHKLLFEAGLILIALDPQKTPPVKLTFEQTGVEGPFGIYLPR